MQYSFANDLRQMDSNKPIGSQRQKQRHYYRDEYIRCDFRFSSALYPQHKWVKIFFTTCLMKHGFDADKFIVRR
jgi:hypothetical protein